MKNTIDTLLIGGTGIAATLGVDAAIPTPDEISMIGQLIIQLVIGLATLWKMFKKPKPSKNDTGFV